MGMGGGGGRGEVTSDINVTPMADVMLVLLIIFMVITPMLQKGVSVELAKTKNPIDMKEADRDDAVLVAVTRDGGETWRREVVPDGEQVFMEDILFLDAQRGWVGGNIGLWKRVTQ